jgi:predicted esterase YcpF (UPF0227 family)
MILYLHGFLSSPASGKARQMQAAMAALGRDDDFLCPALPVSPRAAAEVILALAQLEAPDRLAVVGSSLGGFYATWLAERVGCRAALLNPAIRPYDHLFTEPGWHTDYAGTAVEIRPEFADELRALATGGLTRPERYFLVAATGDQVIDYRDMLEEYGGCRTRLIEGSDHALSDFPVYLPEVLDFCGMNPAKA